MTDEEILNLIPSFPQTQESLIVQLRFLFFVANKVGCYDAADFLRKYVETKEMD
jgi:hypothetical protein